MKLWALSQVTVEPSDRVISARGSGCAGARRLGLSSWSVNLIRMGNRDTKVSDNTYEIESM